MKDFYSVKELSELCQVSEQAIRAYLAREGCAKVASKWQPTQDELRKLFKHYGVDVAQLEQDTQDNCENNKNNTNAVAQDSQTEETAGQTANSELAETLRILNEQLEKKDRQIEWLQAKIDTRDETIRALTATQAIDAFVENKDALLVEPIQEKKEKESAGAVQSDSMTNDEWATLGTWERLRRAWKGVLNG